MQGFTPPQHWLAEVITKYTSCMTGKRLSRANYLR